MKTIYSKPNCPGCVQLKKQYDQQGVEYREVVIGRDVLLEDFIEAFPTVKTVPFVVED